MRVRFPVGPHCSSLGLLFAAAVGACASGSKPPPSPPAAATPGQCTPATRALSDKTCPDAVDDGVECFARAARACMPAEFELTSQNDEGGWVVTRYTVKADGEGCVIDETVDSSRDQHAGSAAGHRVCRTFTVGSSVGGCQVLRLDECS